MIRRLPLCAVLALTACSSATTTLNPAAPSIIIGTGPKGYDLRLDTSLDLAAAAAGTPAAPARTRAQLQRDNFTTGWVRTWGSGDENLEIFEVELGDQYTSLDLIQFELNELTKTRGLPTYPVDQQIPAGTAFILNGTTRAGGHQVFCQGIWFPVLHYAVEVTDCGPRPPYPNQMMLTARAEYEAMVAAIGLPLPTPSASPG